MHSKAKPATKAEKRRMAAIAEIGCVCCRMEQRFMPSWATPAEIHHLLDGGRRMGHLHTVGLCRWHHRGVPLGNISQSEAVAFYGPSLANGSKPFHAHYGSDDELLEYQNTLLKATGFK